MNHPVQFPLTPWTKLREAVGTNRSDDRAAVIDHLCHHYWYPLYSFARWKGWSHEDAQDQTQIFLSRLIERNSLEHADETKGRLRSYLLSAFQNQWSHHRERQRTARRGGNGDTLSLQMSGAEERFARELCDPALNPEDRPIYFGGDHRRWRFRPRLAGRTIRIRAAKSRAENPQTRHGYR